MPAINNREHLENLDNLSFPSWLYLEHAARYKFVSQYVKDKVVVECACGSGMGTAHFLEAGAKAVISIDLNAETVQVAKANHALQRANFFVGNGVTLPLADGCADVYVSLETIEHVDEDDAYVREVKRVLRPKGLFICSTPNRDVCNPGRDLAAQPWNRFHVREYNLMELTDLIAPYFTEMQSYGLNYFPVWLTVVMRLIGRVLPGFLAVRMRQAYKVVTLFRPKPAFHEITPISGRRSPELFMTMSIRKG